MPHAPRYAVDPADPRAPSQEVWDQLDAEERAAIVASLPSEIRWPNWTLPEGDPHFDNKVLVREVLRRYFGRRGRGVYVGNELPVYYPGERVIAPDVMVVLDVDPRPRDRWVVSEEGKGLDVAMEIHVSGNRLKDVRDNVVKFARLGIREYFVFEVRRARLQAFRLQAERGSYTPLLAQGGIYASEMLGLGIAVEGERLRFYQDLAPLPDANELIERMQRITDELTERREAAERLAEETARTAAEEVERVRDEAARRTEEVERRLAEALAEIARLRGDPPKA